MYVVTGATGNVGTALAERLLGAGKQVRVVGRSSENLEPLVDRGAEAAVGTLEDAAFVAEAFEDATAVGTCPSPPGR